MDVYHLIYLRHVAHDEALGVLRQGPIRLGLWQLSVEAAGAPHA
jgi:hypothetical protein